MGDIDSQNLVGARAVEFRFPVYFTIDPAFIGLNRLYENRTGASNPYNVVE